MKKSEIIKKYTELYGKRPTLSIDKTLSEDERFRIKQQTKIEQYLWTLKKQMFIEVVEKSNIDDKISLSKEIVDKFTLNDLMKIYHGYQYKIDINNRSYTLFQD